MTTRILLMQELPFGPDPSLVKNSSISVRLTASEVWVLEARLGGGFQAGTYPYG